MATETQLRFNLDVPPVPANLASNFPSQPSPVIIDRPGDVHPRVQISNAPSNNAFSERLALAIKLARRDLRNGLIRVPSQCVSGEQQTPTQTYVPAPVLSSREHTEPSPRLVSVDTPRVYPFAGYGAAARPKTTSEEGIVGTINVTENAPNYACQLKQVTDEIVRLRKELAAEVKKLKQLKMGNQSGVKKAMQSRRPFDDTDSGRQGWEAEEEEEEKLKRKVAEQTARNTRMLYDLQQQVNELQKDTNGKPPHVRHTKKSVAMHRLAAAHKAVLGTLQNHFSACVSAGCSRPLPAELALLVERLILLGSQLHIDGDPGELLDGIKVCHVAYPLT